MPSEQYNKGLQRSRQGFFGRITQMLSGGTELTEDTWEEIESLLVQADVGVETTMKLLERIRDRALKGKLKDPAKVRIILKEELRSLLKVPQPLNVSGRPLSVVLIVGVNGSGKTTTIGKLAHRLTLYQRNVMLAAGDTFRAAAIDQLKLWGERAGVPVVSGLPGGDPGAVVYDAVKAANSRGINVLLVDTAGRLHNRFNLMEELKKVKGVMAKVVPDAPHETLLVLDGTTGQNALAQAKGFTEAVQISGLIITKLDGTAKGGMLFAIQQELGLPIHYVGLGEGMDDLIAFNPEYFVDGLFEDN